MKQLIIYLFVSISFSVFGQVNDSSLVKTVLSDTLVVDSSLVKVVAREVFIADSTQSFYYQLDSLTNILKDKKQEVLVLEQQISFLREKLIQSNIDTSASLVSIVPDTILVVHQDSIVDSKEDSFIEKDIGKRPIFFEVISCVLLGRDSIAFRLHIKLNMPKERLSPPALQGKVYYYVVGAKKKEVKLLSNIVIRNIVLTSDDNYITVKREINMKSVPKYEGKILIIDDLGLSLQVDGGQRILYFPDNYEFWEKNRRISF